jgi:hypothetical protein
VTIPVSGTTLALRSAMNHTDRLVGLFLQHALPEGTSPGDISEQLTSEAMERGVEATMKMLGTEDAIRMGCAPASTFVCLAMALEEKPQMQWGAQRCYQQALELLGSTINWDRAVVLQQMGAVCLRGGSYDDAAKYFAQCVESCCNAPGHPRDAEIFGGNFSTQQTRLEFMATVEKQRAQTYHKLGDMTRAHSHLAEAQRMDAAAKGGDAVERAVRAVPATDGTVPPAASSPGDAIKQLWAADVGQEPRLKRYRYQDEGSTVLLTLDLNDHVDLPDVSSMVDSLKQFRVHCDIDSVDVRLRLKDCRSRVREFQLWLQPLAHEIIPEDTVPRLKGREGKRRLEIKLFKRDKDRKWVGDLVTGTPKELAKDAEAGTTTGAKVTPKGTALNPLTPEELAQLPRPAGAGCDNKPSAWRFKDAAAVAEPPRMQSLAAAPPLAVTLSTATGEAGLEEMD